MVLQLTSGMCDIEMIKPLLIAAYWFLKAVITMKLVYTEQDIWLIMNRTPLTLCNMIFSIRSDDVGACHKSNNQSLGNDITYNDLFPAVSACRIKY